MRLSPVTSLAIAVLFPLHAALAQDLSQSPVIDTIVVERANVFNEGQSQSNFVFRIMNALHITTRERIIRQELLVAQGETMSALRLQESERNLRALRVFRDVQVDTSRVNGKTAVRVRTRDGWSTKPKFSFSAASDGTITGVIGLQESNLFGTANRAYFAYRRAVDRDGIETNGLFRRVFGTQLDVGGQYFGLSDGKTGAWSIRDPFRSLEDPRSFGYAGAASDRRIIQYRVNSAADTDTTTYRRNAFINTLQGARTVQSDPGGYVRAGLLLQIRNESTVRAADENAGIPDTLKAFFGAFVEHRRAHFARVNYVNGFAVEDLDLSRFIRFGVNLAPEALGYDRTGFGPFLAASAGGQIGSAFVQAQLVATALLTSAGLDSGRVVFEFTAGNKPSLRQVTVLNVVAGILDNPIPGGEFDLGFARSPRSWEPHSFVGTRSIRGTLEHRLYLWDAILNLFGLGLAGFVDYGGAWYADQDPRFGGNIGVGVRTGSAISTSVSTGRIDLGYRFGPDVVGTRWVLSFGAGIPFF
jgi:hypothetical protein